jgi:hypothetical protein
MGSQASPDTGEAGAKGGYSHPGEKIKKIFPNTLQKTTILRVVDFAN